MMKSVLLSLPLLSTIIGLGSSYPVHHPMGSSLELSMQSERSLTQQPKVCEFSISTYEGEHWSKPLVVDLKCDELDTYDTIEGCETTVEFDVFLDTDESTVKSHVRCLEKSVGIKTSNKKYPGFDEYEGIKSIVRQSSGVVYDVSQYGYCPRRRRLNELLYTAIIPTYGKPMSAEQNGFWKETNGYVEFRSEEFSHGFWLSNVIFEPKRALREQLIYGFTKGKGKGEMETVDATSVDTYLMENRFKRYNYLLGFSQDTQWEDRSLFKFNEEDQRFVRSADEFKVYDNPYVSVNGLGRCGEPPSHGFTPRVFVPALAEPQQDLDR